MSGLNNAELFRTCARFADDSKNDEGDEEVVVQATRSTLCLLAHRIQQLTEQIQDLERRLARLAERHAPQLLTVMGTGPDTAVTLLITMGDSRNVCTVRRPSLRCVENRPNRCRPATARSSPPSNRPDTDSAPG
ncbi:hypothetical protein T261_8266 [Streptomyces lydicus]|nr:hypothetical protein T261_8266 [Streptomyces lydicus]